MARFCTLWLSLVIPTLVGSGLVGGCQSTPPSPATMTSPNTVPKPPPAPFQSILAVPSQPEAVSAKVLSTFLGSLQRDGSPPKVNGVWMQADTQFLAEHQGSEPLPAASLTKVATSLAALKVLGVNYRFLTSIGLAGTVKNGVLQGDLVIQGGKDPFFVWEDAIALGNTLNQMGIRQVQGNLVLTGPFYMNFESEPGKSGDLLRQGLNAALWPAEAAQQYQTLAPGTPKPQVAFSGTVQVAMAPPQGLQPIVEHRSLPLVELLKRMNRYSNNAMAEMVAESIGGAQGVAQQAIAATGITASEIQLVNGSGLATENKISPRAACALFRALGQYLQPQGLTIANVLTVVGQDEGILDGRPLPAAAVLKSGTLDRVSALAGAFPTQKYGVVWFAILNGEGDVETSRKVQEQFLAQLQQQWGTTPTIPTAIQPAAMPVATAENRILAKF
jgi:serine-type D-Ala-D-Ala carboxypeptidase/endopeptidase (penicillin-binding protein 4)